MKIGLNGQRILRENPAGPEKFTINLFKALAKVDKENTYVVYFDREPDKGFWEELVSGNKNFWYRVIKHQIFWTQLGLAFELIRNPVDVFFTAVHTIPIVRDEKTKFVTMIHGLEYRYTKGFKNPLKRLKIERPIKYAVKHSDKIISPTKATKDEILKRGWGVSEDRIEIVNEGVTDIFYQRDLNEVNRVKEKYQITNTPYLLFVSTIQPRKNIPNMIEAFSRLLKELKEFGNENLGNLKILLAGKKGWNFEESFSAPKKFGIEENTKFLGRVDDKDLPPLFQGSIGHINVSFEEGFGLPLAESLASGVQSVVSDIPAYKEVGGDLPIYVNPNDVESIKEGIKKLLSNEVSEDLNVSLIERSKLFSWEKTAEKTLEVFKKII